MGGGPAVGGSARPLLVPAADVTAKNLRAALLAHDSKSAYEAGNRLHKAVSFLDSLAPPTPNGGTTGQPKFSKLEEEDSTGLLTRITSIFNRRAASGTSPTNGTSRSTSRRRSTGGNPVLRGLAKFCDHLDILPNPQLIFLILLALTLLLRVSRPALLDRLFIRITLRIALVFCVLLALLWKRGAPLRQLAVGRGPFAHPVDSCLDAYADALHARECDVREGEDELRAHRAKLDALRRELARDPAAATPGAVIVPSRRAAAMIKAGALGAGYDPEKAAEAERLRKEESVARSRAQWRARTERAAENRDPAESIQMRSHAATGYKRHTKELKMRDARVTPRSSGLSLRKSSGGGGGGGNNSQSGGGSLPGTPVFGSFTSVGHSGGVIHGSGGGSGGGLLAADGDEAPQRLSDGSDASGMTAASAQVDVERQGSKRKKLRLFGKKKSRETDGDEGTNGNANGSEGRLKFSGGGIRLRRGRRNRSEHSEVESEASEYGR